MINAIFYDSIGCSSVLLYKLHYRPCIYYFKSYCEFRNGKISGQFSANCYMILEEEGNRFRKGLSEEFLNPYFEPTVNKSGYYSVKYSSIFSLFCTRTKVSNNY